jgi:hypothetical protein
MHIKMNIQTSTMSHLHTKQEISYTPCITSVTMRTSQIVENRNNIVIENIETNIHNNGKKTYAEIVSSKQKPMTSVSRQVSFADKTQRSKKNENNAN